MADQKEQLDQHNINELLSSFYSGLLIYPDNEERNEYLSFDESIKLLDIPPHKFNDLIVGGSLKPYFPWSGHLEVKRKLIVDEYNQLFYSDFSDDDFTNNFIEEPDVLVRAYVNFNGYVRPVESAHYLNAIVVEESKKIAIENVYLIENLTWDSLVHIIGNNGEAPKKVLGKKELFCKDHAYKIYQGVDNNYIDISSYVFLKDDIEQIVEKNEVMITVSSDDEGKSDRQVSQKFEFDNINEKIIKKVLELRKDKKYRNGKPIQVRSGSAEESFYLAALSIIVRLGYRLDQLPNDSNKGQRELRFKVKEEIAKEYSDLEIAEETFKKYCTELKSNIKKFQITRNYEITLV
ncbi:hypothetical protein [Acinetobacter nosocomialis]|uniref:hypothetical protein n=1 Tax=Acinetobacter nosocomialis TaxID=106654 RepID=UPI0005CD05A1|nr:hypothetical protein [Acinetobacter nosocomialis]MBR7740557.1 hypothetical protein [Acinetobacter nosocomialis]MBR7749869.1 hypothetical protein [Acinetobacter nosocomialis]MDO7215036.1 hypothetical protein [Acinetobacter nosocomialis]